VAELVATFTVAGEPQPKQRARVTRAGRSYTPAATVAAEAAVVAAFRLAAPGWQADATQCWRVEVEARCGDRRPKDVDNLLKLVADGLNGVAWSDDKQVVEAAVRKVWVEKGEAGLLVSLWLLPEAYPTAKRRVS